MQKIVYAGHLPESHKLIAGIIRSQRPKVYLSEAKESLDPIFNEFLDNPSATIEDLEKRLDETGWKFKIKENRKAGILKVLQELGIKRVGIESDVLVEDYLRYQSENVLPTEFDLSLDKSHLLTAQTLDKARKGDSRYLKLYNGLLDLLAFEDLDSLKSDYKKKLKDLSDKLKIFAEKEIQRERYHVKRIKELLQPDLFAYFGFAHRAISHLLKRDSISIPYEFVGDLFMDPEEKLTMLVKYELLGLDPEELRSKNPALDCDPSKKDFYLEIIPDWFGFYDRNKKEFNVADLVKYFWANINKTTSSIN